MPDLKVFISSTYRDLDEHRKAVIERLRRLDDVIVVCMEEFGARAAHPTDVCRQKLEPCDLYVGLFGCHYGSVPNGGDHSKTEMEYQNALDKGIERLVFISDKTFRAPADLHQTEKNFDRQQKLRSKVMAELAIDYFSNDVEALASKVATAASNWRDTRKRNKKKPKSKVPHRLNRKRQSQRHRSLKSLPGPPPSTNSPPTSPISPAALTN